MKIVLISTYLNNILLLLIIIIINIDYIIMYNTKINVITYTKNKMWVNNEHAW